MTNSLTTQIQTCIQKKQIENDLIWAAKQEMQLLLRRLSSKSEIQKVKNGPFHRLLAQIYTHKKKSSSNKEEYVF